jgi:hypothetical protein
VDTDSHTASISGAVGSRALSSSSNRVMKVASGSMSWPITLAAPYEDEVLAEIDILDPEADALHQAKTTAVKEPRHEEMLACHDGEQVLDLGASEDGGRPDKPFASDRGYFPVQGPIEDLAVQEN